MTSLVVTELGTKENPHQILPPKKDRIKGQYYINKKGKLRSWNGKILIDNEYYANYMKTRYHNDPKIYRKKARDKYQNYDIIRKNEYLEKGKAWRQNNKEKIKEYNKEHYKNRTFEERIHDIVRNKYNDKRVKGGRIKCNLTEEYILKLWEKQNGLCALSGKKMNTEVGSMNIISIDRIDSKNGNYVEGEIQLVCYIVNIMKMHFPQEEFIRWCENIALYSGSYVLSKNKEKKKK